MRPEVGAEVAAQHSAVAGRLDIDGELRGAFDLARDVFMQTGVASPAKSLAQLLDGDGEFVPDVVHTQDDMPFQSIVNGNQPYSLKGNSADDEGMENSPVDKWPQRTRFRERLKEYQERTGETHEEFAAFLGLSLEHFRNSLYRKEKRLGIDAISKSAGRFGCSVNEFVDDPAADPTSPDVETSEIDRFMLRVMGSDISRLTEAQKQSAFEAWRAIVRGYEPHK